MNAKDLQNELGYFTGSENYYKHWLGVIYTDGIKFLSDEAKSYWLIDAIASHQSNLKNEEFQTWTLTVNDDNSAILVADDGNGNVLTQEEIPYTDFPLETIKIWVSSESFDGKRLTQILMLPSEY